MVIINFGGERMIIPDAELSWWEDQGAELISDVGLEEWQALKELNSNED